jgi:hypothetical protein
MGDYDNFYYRVEAMINDKGNSGQYFRTVFAKAFPAGYEAQINATHGDKVKTGSLYPDGRQKDMREPEKFNQMMEGILRGAAMRRMRPTPRSRNNPRTCQATASVTISDTMIATPNGSDRQMLPVTRISRNRAGRIAPSRCHDAAMKPPSPNSAGATQLLKSSASGAPWMINGTAVPTNAQTADASNARPMRSFC